MVLCVGIEQASDHPLILGVVLQCLTLEEVDAAFAQGERYLDSVIPKDQSAAPEDRVQRQRWASLSSRPDPLRPDTQRAVLSSESKVVVGAQERQIMPNAQLSK